MTMKPNPTIQNVNATDAAALVERGEAVLVDVREPEEWHEARIPGAIHVPLAQLLERASELPVDRVLILQCRSGNRSRSAVEALIEHGRQDVRNLAGGIIAWAREGRPIEVG